MSRDYGLYLQDMRVSCDKILRYVHGLSCAQLMQDDTTFEAVCTT